MNREGLLEASKVCFLIKVLHTEHLLVINGT